MMHHRLPVKLFIYNNGGYLTIKQTQQLGFDRLMGSNEQSGISFPDFSSIAKAHNLDYIRIDSHDDLQDVVKEIIVSSGPSICELVLDSEQAQQPKAINRRLEDGTTEPTTFEDLYPFLDKGEVAENLLEPIVWTD